MKSLSKQDGTKVGLAASGERALGPLPQLPDVPTFRYIRIVINISDQYCLIHRDKILGMINVCMRSYDIGHLRSCCP